MTRTIKVTLKCDTIELDDDEDEEEAQTQFAIDLSLGMTNRYADYLEFEEIAEPSKAEQDKINKEYAKTIEENK